jgi:hypothetical protein
MARLPRRSTGGLQRLIAARTSLLLRRGNAHSITLPAHNLSTRTASQEPEPKSHERGCMSVWNGYFGDSGVSHTTPQHTQELKL